MKTTIESVDFDTYSARTLARAKKLARGERVAASKIIHFESPADMLQVLTQERVRLCAEVRKRSYSVSELATALHRDAKSVRRDIAKLEQFGVLTTREESNPGHGRVKIVVPVARKLLLRASL